MHELYLYVQFVVF